MFLSTQKYLFMLDLNSANVSKFIEIKEYNGEEIYTTSYSYDVLGNLVGIVDEEGNEWVFEYDSLGRKVSDIDPDIGVSNYTYDLNGNLINEIRSHGGLIQDKNFIRSYNELGQLVNISLLNGTLVEEYVYDGNGERVKSYNPIKNETIYTPFKEFMQIRNSEGIFNYTYIYEGETLVARINSDGSKYFYHPDHLGSTTLITDESGNVVEDNYYLPYGELVGESDEKRLYENKDYSSDIGEYDYNFRNYNPSYGIFLKADSMLPDVYDPQQLNRYMFERGNPYVYLDESGHWIIQAGVNFKGAFSGIIGSKGIGIVISNDPSQKGFQFGFYNSDTFGGAIPAKGSVEFEASFNQNDNRVEDIVGQSQIEGVSGGFFVTGGIDKNYNSKGDVTKSYQIGKGVGIEGHTGIKGTDAYTFYASENKNDEGQFYSRNNNPNEGFINPEILDIMQGGDIRYVTM